MSKQKNTDLSETEKPEVTENLVEQSELEGISSIKEEVVESKPEIEKPVKQVAKINRVTTAAVKANKKMGVAKFLSYYPQDIYVEALLRHYYPRSFFTVDEWFLRIEEILNMPINS
jgi:hypothetical protein